jgi:hypothetical protein
MPRRPERLKSIIAYYWYGGRPDAPATWRMNLTNVLAWLVALVLIALVGWLYLLQASQVSSYAHEIRTLENEKERLNRLNTVLTGQVAELGSITRIRAAAEQLGYSLPSAGDVSRRIVLVYQPLPTPTAAVPVAGAVADGGQSAQKHSLIQRLQQQLDGWLQPAQGDSGGE